MAVATNIFPYGYWSGNDPMAGSGFGAGVAPAPPANALNYQAGSYSVPNSWTANASNQAQAMYAKQVAEQQYRAYLGQLGGAYGFPQVSGPPGTGSPNLFSGAANPFTYGAGPATFGYATGAQGAPSPYTGPNTAGIPAFNTQSGGAYANYGLGGQIMPTYPGNPFSTLYNVKSPEINTRIDTALSGLDQMTQKNASELDNFINKFTNNTPQAAANTGQENSVIDRYYNGGVKNDLDLLSQQKAAALRQAGDRALDFARHGIALAALSRGGTDSSYLRQMGLDQSRGIESDIALKNAQEARDNFNYLQQAQLGLRGQRQSASDELAKRELAPSVARAGLFTNTVDNLSKLAQAKLANSFYSVKKDDGTSSDPVAKLFSTGFNPYA